MFYILNNSGDIKYTGSETSESDVRTDKYPSKIAPLARRGFYLYRDPTRDHLVVFFKGNITVSNQYYAVYYAEDDTKDIYGEVRSRIRSAFRSNGWNTTEAEEGSEAIYTHLDDTPPEELAIGDETLQQLLAAKEPDSAPVQLGAPDYRGALGVCKAIERVDADARVSICSQGPVDELPESDVIIDPTATTAPGEAIAATRQTVEQAQLTEKIEQTRATIKAYIAADTGEATDKSRAGHITRRFRSEIASRGEDLHSSDLVLRTPRERHSRKATIAGIGAAFGVLAGTILAGVIAAWYGALSPIVDRLTAPAEFTPAILGAQSSATVQAPGGIFFAGCMAILAVGGLQVWAQVRPGNSRISSGVLSRVFGLILGNKQSESTPDTAGLETIIDALETIVQHPGIEEAGGVQTVLRDVFEATAVEVHDRQTVRRQLALSTVGWTLFATAVSGFICGVVIAVGVTLTQFWYPLLDALVKLTLLVVGGLGVAGGIQAVSSAVSHRDMAAQPPKTGDQSDVRLLLQGGIIVAGGVMLSYLGGQLWQSADALSVQLLLAAIGETVGQFMGLESAITVVFFTTVIAAITGLLGHAVTGGAKRAYATSLSFAGLFVIILLVISAGRLVGSPLATIAGCLLGVILGVALFLVLPARTQPSVINTVGGIFGLAVSGVVTESLIDYEPPVVYNRAGGSVTAGSFDGFGIAVQGTTGAVIAVLSIIVMVAVIFVATREGLRTNRRIDVLVLGPRGSNPGKHVATLFRHIIAEAGERDANKTIKRIGDNRNSLHSETDVNQLLEYSGIEPATFTVAIDEREISVCAPLSETNLVDSQLVRAANSVSQGQSIREFTSKSLDTVNKSARREVAEVLKGADVLVLLYPISGVAKQFQPERDPNWESAPSHWYLQTHQQLLNSDAAGNGRRYAVVPNAVKRPNDDEEALLKSDTQREMEREAENHAYDDCSARIKKRTRSELSNINERMIPIIHRTRTSETTGLDKEVEAILGQLN